MPSNNFPSQYRTNAPQYFGSGMVRLYPSYQNGNFYQNNSNGNVTLSDNLNSNRQSRIRRYGAPVIMEEDDSNFHSRVSENCRE